jgi:histidinol-phosphate aminotransferase
MSEPSPRALPHIARLHAYTPGLQPAEAGWVKLNTNECPYPPSPRVAEAIRREIGADGSSLRLYPNPKSSALRAAVAKLHGHALTEANVCVGNGSDDILNLLIRAFCASGHEGGRGVFAESFRQVQEAGSAEAGRLTGDGSPCREPAVAGFTLPSYSLYPVLVEIQNGATNVIEFDRSMRLPAERIAASPARIFFLTSPNAPTGVAFANADLERVLQSFQGLFVLDEAYAPFARENALPLLARHPNLVVTRTLSKAHALAGIRVGYALAHPNVIEVLDRVRDSYNVSRLSQAAALAAVEDPGYYETVVAKIRETRDRCVRSFAQQRGWFTYESQANFIFTEPKNARGESGAAVAKAAYDFLYANKVLVRHFPSHALTTSFLRISVGTDDEMLVLNRTLDAWQKSSLNERTVSPR